MATLKSFELNGNKLSFANWISTISPTDCLFTSMIETEKVDQPFFQWQTDALAAAGQNSAIEGSKSVAEDRRPTADMSNVTQILRKVITVSDTANSVDTYGRNKELAYQMEKAARELNRDIEWAFLNNHPAETTTDLRVTSGVRGLVAAVGVECPDTGATAYKFYEELDYDAISDMAYQMYLAGNDADTIMYNPKHAFFFSSFVEKGPRVRLFEDTSIIEMCVSTTQGPLGRTFKLIPNRWMPEDRVYFFNPEHFTKILFREPKRTLLAKTGSSEKWMIELEVGLRLAHPYAAGILGIGKDSQAVLFKSEGSPAGVDSFIDVSPTLHLNRNDETGADVAVVLGKRGNATIFTHRPGSDIKLRYKMKPRDLSDKGDKDKMIRVELICNGRTTGYRDHRGVVLTGDETFEIVSTVSAGKDDAGIYEARALEMDLTTAYLYKLDFTNGIAVNVGRFPAI